MTPHPPVPVLIHPYPSPSAPPDRPFLAYEHLPNPNPNPLPSGKRQNILLFLPGLGEGPLDIPYTRTALAPRLAEIHYALFETRLSSSYSGFGYSSLAQDAKEIDALVRHLRKEVVEEGGRVVVMGHSTGAQGCLAHAGGGFGGVDGFVLQGAVSDREAMGMGGEGEVVERGVRWAVEVGGKQEGRMVPREMLPEGWRGQPVSAYRWWSLAGKG